jgi:DNA-nicking Smr family endonuclease|tara:strand:+ start:816013 stop:816630 length:618 start_codon:yes stop_codon:yes gene_type:complete
VAGKECSVTDDDNGIFRQQMKDVEPLKKPAERVRLKQPVVMTPGLESRRRAAEAMIASDVDGLSSEAYIPPVKPRDVLSFKRSGVQHGVFKNLRMGNYLVDSRLDLHRLTVEQARQQVYLFIQDCLKHDIRCALITHGRGENREKPALLKSCTNHWLQQMDEVLAFHSAQPQHGGTGATYVMLRKSAEKRVENLERHHKGIKSRL